MAVSGMGDQRTRGDSGRGVTDGQHANESGWRVWCHVNKRGWVDVKALVRTWGCSEGWCGCGGWGQLTDDNSEKRTEVRGCFHEKHRSHGG